MSAIAYITDSKMLELHRLNAHKTMNFWRLSNKVNFSDFKKGDLVFFLSKDKEHMNNKEKGIVGFGRLETVHLNTVSYLWNKYGSENGYNSLEEFKQAIIKVSKDKKIPKKISSFYLSNVSFFQAPIYLSECGMSISSNVESYIYLKPDDVANKILDYAKNSMDLWSSLESESSIEDEKIIYSLYTAHKNLKDIKLTEKLTKKAYKTLKQYVLDNPEYSFIQDSKTELYKLEDKELTILFYHDKDIDERLVIGQALMYREEIRKYAPETYVSFKTTDNNQIINKILLG